MKTCRISALATLLLSLAASAAFGVFGIGDVVIDPTNLVQTTLTAVNTARSVAQQATALVKQATQIANQIKQLENDATNLVTIPVQMSAELTAVLGQYQALLRQAEGLAYDYSSVRDHYERLFDAARRGRLTSLPGYTAQLMTQLRQASGQAVQSQAILQRLSSHQGTLRRALAASEAAQGNLAVQQAGNQLSGVLATQQADLLHLLSTTGRAQVSLLAAQAALDDAARANAQGAMQGWGVCQHCKAGLRAFPRLH